MISEVALPVNGKNYNLTLIRKERPDEPSSPGESESRGLRISPAASRCRTFEGQALGLRITLNPKTNVVLFSPSSVFPMLCPSDA
jgi:hypothetical protein